MSFKCAICGKQQGKRVKPVMVVLETRAVSYPVRIYNGATPDYGGQGIEIVKEVPACAACAREIIKAPF